MTSTSQKGTRIADVDALRGFALLGISQVNIMAFSSIFYGLPTGEPEQSLCFNDLCISAVLQPLVDEALLLRATGMAPKGFDDWWLT